jgi:anthranilate phosphoribosyltransferase
MIVDATNLLLDGMDLTVDESRDVMEEIMSAEASAVQVAAYLTALRLKGETTDEILGSAQAMRNRVSRIRHKRSQIFDNCGTGGDHSGTFNISTTTSFVLAGCGVPIAKHGNRSITSRCGSADVLQSLGANLDLTPDQIGRCIDKIGIGFLFAPYLHPAMKNVAPVRKSLGFRTVFNILGPLTNPAFATHQMIGVFDPNITETLAMVAKKLGIKNAVVVHSMNGMDELTTASSNKVSIANNGTALSFQIHPRDFGFETCHSDDLRGGSAKRNATIMKSILSGKKGSRRDTVLLNAGLALMVAGTVKSIKEGIKQASEGIDSGKALAKLNEFIEMTKSFGNA